jgi:mannose/fructose/N-acetylgalactosamine-specific phosphotransferase system component IIC
MYGTRKNPARLDRLYDAPTGPSAASCIIWVLFFALILGSMVACIWFGGALQLIAQIH